MLFLHTNWIKKSSWQFLLFTDNSLESLNMLQVFTVHYASYCLTSTIMRWL